MHARSTWWMGSIFAALCLQIAGCAGADGSSCSVAENADGSATITCEDGTTATVRNGDDGMDGMDGVDGTSCTVTTGEGNAAVLTCEDGTTATITNGMDGEDGSSCTVAEAEGVATITCEDGTTASVSDGEDGATCTVADNGDGTSTITCPDGSTSTVSDGADGASCTVVDNGDDTSTISCDDGTSSTVVSGTSCTLTDGGDATFTIDCGDGTVYRAASVETETLPFPAAGDARVAVSGPNLWNVNDYVEGTRSTTLTPLRGVLTLALTNNVLACDTQDVEILVNGVRAATFSIPAGATQVVVPFSTAGISGSSFTIRLRTTRTVNGGCGSTNYADGTSTIQLIGVPVTP